MSMSRKQALNDLQAMFPSYDRSALNTLLRANGTHPFFYFNRQYVESDYWVHYLA